MSVDFASDALRLSRLSLCSGYLQALLVLAMLIPGGSEIAEKPTGLTIRVIEVLPLAHVFFCDGLKDGERLPTMVGFDQRPGLLDELSNLVNHCPNMPIRFGRT